MKKIISSVCLILVSLFVFAGCGAPKIQLTIQNNNIAFLTELEIEKGAVIPTGINESLISAYNTKQSAKDGFHVELEDLQGLLEQSILPYNALSYTLEDAAVQKKTKDLKKLNNSLNAYYSSVLKVKATVDSMQKTLVNNEGDADSLLNTDYINLKGDITNVLSNTVTYTRNFTTILKSIYDTTVKPDTELVNLKNLQIESFNAYASFLDVYVSIYLKTLNTVSINFNAGNTITAEDLYALLDTKQIYKSTNLESDIIIDSPSDLLTMQNLFITLNSNISILNELKKSFSAENLISNVTSKYPLANPTSKINDYLENYATNLEKEQYNLINTILHNTMQAFNSIYSNTLL